MRCTLCAVCAVALPTDLMVVDLGPCVYACVRVCVTHLHALHSVRGFFSENLAKIFVFLKCVLSLRKAIYLYVHLVVGLLHRTQYISISCSFPRRTFLFSSFWLRRQLFNLWQEGIAPLATNYVSPCEILNYCSMHIAHLKQHSHTATCHFSELHCMNYYY